MSLPDSNTVFVNRSKRGEHFKEPEPSGPEMLRYFMDEHELKQSDLPEVGSQRAVSEVLKGKRELTAKQIRALAARFNVAPAVFI